MTALTECPTTNRVTAPAVRTTAAKATRYTLAGLRLALGGTFLWAFIDKVFGLGFATPGKNAWINGGSLPMASSATPSPDLSKASTTASPEPPGPTGFMIGLAAIGTALILGIGLRVAGNTLGLGKTWARLPIVGRQPWLK